MNNSYGSGGGGVTACNTIQRGIFVRTTHLEWQQDHLFEILKAPQASNLTRKRKVAIHL